MDSLPSFPLSGDKRLILAAVGSGGKTSCLTLLAHRYRSMGHSVLLTTTTHMRRTEDVNCASSLSVLRGQLKETGFLFAGTPASQGKIGSLPEEHYTSLSQSAQVTLVEADGSRELPLKMPAPWEPALPKRVDYVLILLGLSGLGKPLHQVCHRWELAAQALSCPKDCVVTPELAARLLKLGYLHPLKKAGLPCSVILNLADTVPAEWAGELKQLLAPTPAFAVSLRSRLDNLPPFETWLLTAPHSVL